MFGPHKISLRRGVLFVFSVYLFSLRDVMCYDRPGDVFVNMEGDTLAYNTQTLATGVVFFL